MIYVSGELHDELLNPTSMSIDNKTPDNTFDVVSSRGVVVAVCI